MKTSWESSLIFVDESTAEKILNTIRNMLESFWPEPISITHTKDEIRYYMSINVSHKRVTKVEIQDKSNKSSKNQDTFENNIKAKLKMLEEIYEEGLITKDEYLKKKRKVLESL